jgi:uncharacterized protein (TIGR03437 family)
MFIIDPMIRNVARKFVYSAACVFPVILYAFSTGPPVMRTGAPADGGLTCVVCHKTYVTANSDPRGSVTITGSPYIPGVTQSLRVTIQHPEQQRWGFQLITRLASDPTKQAGTFSTNALVRVRCSTGVDAPCNGSLEFAEHNNAQFTAVGAGYTYSVDWTPPATSVGDIVLYAAGNAANGDGTFNGDRIYTTSTTLSPNQCSLSNLPFISAAVSAASYKNTISPGSIVSIFGTGFQPLGITRSLYPSDVASNAFPTKLSCVLVQIDRKPAPLTFVGPNQINVQVPYGTSTTSPQVQVVVNPNASIPVYSAPIQATGNAYSPALFTSDGQHAAAQFTGAAPKPGDMITLYATGLGDTNPHVDAGVLVAAATPCVSTPTITIGGITVAATDIEYVGLTPGTISGLYQINVKVPLSAPAGDLAIKLQTGGVTSPDGVTIKVATP